MAKLHGGLVYSGSMFNITYYKRKDMDMTIVRAKGGPSTKMLKTSPKFEKTRRNNSEFGGRSTATKHIREAIGPLKELSDFNIAAALNSLLKPIHELDTTHAAGQRNIDISKNPGILEGFQLNRKNILEAVFTSTLAIHISEDVSASIEIPAVVPGTNFFPVGTYPMYRWEAAFGAVPDLYHGRYHKKDLYFPDTGIAAKDTAFVTTPWFDVTATTPRQTLDFESLLEERREGREGTCMLTIGISFGVRVPDGGRQVKYAGAGKIILARTVNG